ncbi:MAG: Ferredoxin-2 [Alphaproteobacteria bacterium ADurb.Bin438]|nr:MAG: Ferredoxin-2 [Alphaproteobacteria bacterium ADurb.Bin438]
MPSVVSDKCKKCYSCVEVCPVDAFRESDDSEMLVISPEVCIDCGVCIAECPEGAIHADGEADDKWVKFNEEKAAVWGEAKK